MKSFGTIAKDGQVRVVAFGALTDGTPVVVNSDGTVSVVTETSATQVLGSATVFEAASSTNVQIVYDSTNNKVVIAYKDNGNSGYGTAIVGTVSGTSISFGTAVVFESAISDPLSITYDANAQKVVISYRDRGNSNYGTAIVGTVSGTSISFGSAVVYESATVTTSGSAYDANAQKVVIAYRDGGNSNRGTAVVGTISGTSISFGSATVFETGETSYVGAVYDANAQKIVLAYRDETNSDNGTAIVGTITGTSISFGNATVFENAATVYPSITYDSKEQKVVIAYQDDANSDYGTAIVGTVSGTSISFGTAVVFENAASSFVVATYDATAEKVVIAYQDGGNSDYGTVISGTVSGTSISFDSATVFESAITAYIALTYDSNAEKVVIAYRDYGNSSHGTSIVFQTGYTSTTLTSENYIGFSDGAYADTQSAVINTANTIDRNQSGLTAGQTYFVQTDGTLGTTAASPSVTAGTAISATELIVKG